MKLELPQTLKKLYKTGFVVDKKNVEREAISSTISEAEAVILMRIVTDIKAEVTLETGLAFGASAVAIAHAKKGFPSSRKMHYAIDPNQNDFYEGAALVAIEQEKLEDQFKLLEGPSHMMMPELIRDQEKLDFAFVDGWHTFDYTLLDFFLIDKILKPGGVIAFHDMQALSKQKVLRYILTHRQYTIEKNYAVRGNESRLYSLKFFLWRLFKNPSLLFSWFHWHYQLFNSSGLIVLKKTKMYEPNFDFYKNF
jgi:predicted O-methyltransferase YrrM